MAITEKPVLNPKTGKFRLIVKGTADDLKVPHSFALFGKKDRGLSASTHGPERRKPDRPVCDCDDD
jgi:hypothetical protein